MSEHFDPYNAEISEAKTEILPGAFRNDKSIRSVSISGNTAEIGEGAFEGCTCLERLVLADGVRVIHSNAFAGCVSLAEVTLPDSVAGIHESAFKGCTGLKRLRLPGNLRYMDKSVFEGCVCLTEVKIPAAVKIVSADVFKNCSALKHVIFEGNDTKCYQEAFTGCVHLSTPSAAAVAERFVRPLSFFVRAGADGFAGRMSNFTQRSFIFDGISCVSIESVLQSFRFREPKAQAKICGMQAKAAREAAAAADWKENGVLYWQGQEYFREGEAYQKLLDRLFMSVYRQDDTFRVEVTFCRGAQIRLRHWSRNPMAVLLTQKEFLERLKALSWLKPGESLNTMKEQSFAEISYVSPKAGRPCIVVLGGSFNPPTLAHLRLMQAAIEATGAKKGIFVPSNAAYVRRKMRRQQESEPFSEQLRMEMLEAMCAGDCRLAADDCEYGRNGQAKTYETMETIQKKYPDALLYFVAGGDKLSVIPRWHRIEEFLEQFKILVVKRKGIEPERLIAANPFLSCHANAFAMLKEPEGLLGISSTRVRLLLKSGDATAEKLVHPGVWKLLLEAGNWNLDITRFRGDYDFLSNFYEAPLEYEGLYYKNAEAAFQAQKCEEAVQKADFCDLAANKAKKLGSRIKLRDDWENVKLKKMLEIVRAKFTQNPELAAKLLDTGTRRLLEGNTWHDVFWGIDLETGQGENHLGQILMQVRSELKAGGQ